MEGIPDRKRRNEELKQRTKVFALRVIKLVDSLPNTLAARTIGGQLIRSGTSAAADYISKIGILEEETDESVFWMEMLASANIIKLHLLQDLMDEGRQLTAIWVSSINTARGRKR